MDKLSQGTNDTQVKTDTPPASSTKEHRIVVNGEPMLLTYDELVARAQKVANAELETQKAVESQRASQKFEQFYKNAKAAASGDEAAFRAYAEEIGMPAEAIETVIEERRAEQVRKVIGDNNPPARTSSNNAPDDIIDEVVKRLTPLLQKNAESSSKAVSVRDMDPKLQKFLMKLVGENLEGDVMGALDKDPILGRIMTRGSDRQKQALKRKVIEETQRRAREGYDLTDPEQTRQLLQHVRAEIVDLGIRPESDLTSFAGLGSSSSGLPSLYQPETPPKRPEGGMASPHYDDYLLKKMAYVLANKT